MAQNPTDDVQTKLIRLLSELPPSTEKDTADFGNLSVNQLAERFAAFIRRHFQGYAFSPPYFRHLTDDDPIHCFVDLPNKDGDPVRVATQFITENTITYFDEFAINAQNLAREFDVFLLISAVPLMDEKSAHLERMIHDAPFIFKSPNLIHIPAEKAWSLLFDVEYENENTKNDRKRTQSKGQSDHLTQAKPLSADHSIHMLHDMPVERADEDLLGFGDYAGAIAGLIDHPETKAPLTLAINAKWGTGKTSLANLIKNRLETKPEGEDEKPHKTYWFNAWMHDDANDLGAAFMADIVRQCDAIRPWWQRARHPLPTALCDAKVQHKRRLRLFGAIVFTTVIFLIALAIYANPAGIASKLFKDEFDAVKGFLPAGVMSLIVMIALAVWIFQRLTSTLQTISAFVTAPQGHVASGSLQMVREQLQILIHEVTPKGSKFVVFIDDLERCRPPKSIDVLEVVNQLLDFDPVVTIAIADMPALAAMAEIKYDTLAKRYDPDTTNITAGDDCHHTYGRLFLQKFIQLQFDLPEMPSMRSDGFISNLISPREQSNEEARSSNFEDLFTHEVRVAKNMINGAFGPYGFLDIFRANTNDISFSRAVGVYLYTVLAYPTYFASILASVVMGTRPKATAESNLLKFINISIFLSQFICTIAIYTLISNGITKLAFRTEFIPYFVFGLPVPEFITSITNWGPALNIYINGWSGLALFLPAVFLNTALFIEIQKKDEARKYRLARQEIDALLSAEPDKSIDNFLNNHEFADPEATHKLLSERRLRRLGSDSEAYRATRAYILNHLTPHPRNIKRILNRLRLLLFLLNQRQLLAGKDVVRPEAIGKWVLIQEKWPELEKLIRIRPKTMIEIERAKTDEGYKKKLYDLVPAYADDPQLIDLLKDGHRLAPYIGRITLLHA